MKYTDGDIACKLFALRDGVPINPLPFLNFWSFSLPFLGFRLKPETLGITHFWYSVPRPELFIPTKMVTIPSEIIQTDIIHRLRFAAVAADGREVWFVWFSDKGLPVDEIPVTALEVPDEVKG